MKNKSAVSLLIGVSGVAVGFLIWLIYFQTPIAERSDWVQLVPAFNAFWNSMATVSLILGFLAIKEGDKKSHKAWMLGAFVCSTLFLIGYLIYHAYAGHTVFTGVGLMRSIYYSILVSHIFLSSVVLPVILITFYFALTSQFEVHKKIARWTYPIWLYVSVTGVIVFFLLRLS